MNVRIALLASAGLFVASPAFSQDAGLVGDAKAFGTRASAEGVDISPGGTKLLTIDPGPGKSSILTIVDMASGSQRPILKSNADPEALYWCKFEADTQLICKYGGGAYSESDLVGFTRLITMDANGQNMRQLGQSSHFIEEGLRQVDGAILDWLPNAQGSVLMERSYLREAGTTGSRFVDNRDGLGVDRIDLATLKVTPVEPARLMAGDYMSDGHGNVRLMALTGQSSGELTGVTAWRYRPTGSLEWKPFGTYNSSDQTGTQPLAVDSSCDCAYVLKKTDGRDALYTVKLDGSMATKLIAANKNVDIGSVMTFGRGQRVIGYHYTEEVGQGVYFDEEFSKLADALARVLPKQPLINFVESSADGTKLLIRASGDTDPGTYYYYDKLTRRLDEVEPIRPLLEGHALAHVKPISVPSSDGAQIPAYLTLPPGKAAKNLPAIVLPHGGPSSRDTWGFDWLAQFLAARGYAVIQPNYRGSAGYGDEWMGANGFRDWRKAISDVSASANYLVSQGIADPKRLAIVGWSYGGYAALQSAAVEPTLYKAAVAIAPVTDLTLLKKEAEHYTNYELVKEFVGSGPEVIEGSPLRHAAEVKVPILMFHGDMDQNVAIEQSEKMADALRSAGDKAELVRFKGLDHQLDDSAARITMLTRIGEFLDAAIGH
jgi:dipeptidyl aminopeptidase/acylaminoacyl peptidase